MSFLQNASLIGIVPVINIPRPELAVPLCDALAAGGLPQIEVTLRNETALESIRTIKRERPDFPVSAGTVLSCEQVDAALAAGADAIVTPGFNPKVVRHCLDKGAEILPGCVTPAEIEAGLEAGLTVFKFFPAENMGGVQTIRQLCGPYRNVRFVPTGGITLDNLSSYLAFSGVAAVGGSCMAPASMVAAGDFASITALCREAVRRSLGFALRHVGVNGASPEEGERMASRFAEIFDLPVLPGGRSDFAGTLVEFCKDEFPGEAGHIAISTLNVERAAHYLEGRGVGLREDYRTPSCIYLKEEFAGFAVHIVKA